MLFCDRLVLAFIRVYSGFRSADCTDMWAVETHSVRNLDHRHMSPVMMWTVGNGCFITEGLVSGTHKDTLQTPAVRTRVCVSVQVKWGEQYHRYEHSSPGSLQGSADTHKEALPLTLSVSTLFWANSLLLLGLKNQIMNHHEFCD